jgi:hypothetical protein
MAEKMTGRTLATSGLLDDYNPTNEQMAGLKLAETVVIGGTAPPPPYVAKPRPTHIHLVVDPELVAVVREGDIGASAEFNLDTLMPMLIAKTADSSWKDRIN